MSQEPAVLNSNEVQENPNVVVILPAKNESATIGSCIEAVKQSKYKPTIIVADGYSTDDTRIIASECGAEIVTSEKRIHPGKGAAMKTGLRAAFVKEAKVVVFINSDLTNLKPELLDNLVEPIIDGRYDMTRGVFLLAPRDAGVTKLVAKQLLYVFFPEISHFDQPLSGEVAAKAEVWKDLMEATIPDGWGADIWFLIETAMRGYRIREVFLGKKELASFSSDEDDLSKLSKISEQVALAIIKEAIRHGRIDNVNTFDPPT
jgi:glycosyltransferase involved in cell wall biosynthesis